MYDCSYIEVSKLEPYRIMLMSQTTSEFGKNKKVKHKIFLRIILVLFQKNIRLAKFKIGIVHL